MKNVLKLAFILTLIISIVSCSKDEAPTVISANDLTSTIDENPENGQSIGTVTTNISGTFTIVSQTPNGAFSVNSQTGEVSVADSSLFDYETNQNLEAVVLASGSGTESVAYINVSLNNIDDISFFLSDSKMAYETGAKGDWIIITEEEYNVLATNLNNVNKAGAIDEHYEMPQTVNGFSDVTWTNITQPSIPSESLLFAFKFTSNSGTGSSSRVKLSSTSPTAGYSDIGSPLPETNESGSLHFVLKGNDSPTNTQSYLCIYASRGIKGSHNISNYNGRSLEGNQNNLENGFFYEGFVFHYQGLSTTQKQWE